ncbi:MAG: ABC transporter permease [Promethearchaeota archaeon]
MNLRILKLIKIQFYQLGALVIKDIKLKSRYKAKFAFAIVTPFTTFIVPFLIFRKIFDSIGNESFGIWTPENYILFILTGIFIMALTNLLVTYSKSLLEEKYWKTLPVLFLSPINFYNILVSKLLSELFIFIIPLSFVIASCLIIAEASLLTIILVITVYFLSAIFISSIGLIIGSFRLSVEGGFRMFFLIVNLFLIFSCIKYPREFFPDEFQYLIIFNPFYYYWDIMRVSLVLGSETIIFNSKYLIHFYVIILFSSITPMLSVKFFNYFYKKYGLVGY